VLKNLPAPEQLTRTYPHDPRSHYLLGVEKMKAGDFPGAEADLRAALAEKRNLEMFFADGRVEGAARATLALVLVSQDRAAEAKAIAQPACSSKEPYVHDQLLDLKLCP
jgi:rhomboid protease GluP